MAKPLTTHIQTDMIRRKPIRWLGDSLNRVLCVAKFAETVYVLHAFEKKTRRTPKRDIDLAAKRYRDLMAERRTK